MRQTVAKDFLHYKVHEAQLGLETYKYTRINCNQHTTVFTLKFNDLLIIKFFKTKLSSTNPVNGDICLSQQGPMQNSSSLFQS